MKECPTCSLCYENSARFCPTDGDVIPLTVSIGGILCSRDASVSELMRAADKRLYEAKNRGRNRAVTEPMPAAA